MKPIDKAIWLIKENDGDFEGPKNECLVKKAQHALGIKFPPTYKQFLMELGCGDIEGFEFYGVINSDFENAGVPDAIWLTLSERKEGLPEDLVIVGSSGYGTYFAIDTSRRSDTGECPVIEYMKDCERRFIANDFGEFLLNEINSVLE